MKPPSDPATATVVDDQGPFPAPRGNAVPLLAPRPLAPTAPLRIGPRSARPLDDGLSPGNLLEEGPFCARYQLCRGESVVGIVAFYPPDLAPAALDEALSPLRRDDAPGPPPRAGVASDGSPWVAFDVFARCESLTRLAPDLTDPLVRDRVVAALARALSSVHENARSIGGFSPASVLVSDSLEVRVVDTLLWPAFDAWASHPAGRPVDLPQLAACPLSAVAPTAAQRDIASFALCVHLLLSGKRLVPLDSGASLGPFLASPLDPSLFHGLPSGLFAWVARCLGRDVSFQTVSEAHAALGLALDTPPQDPLALPISPRDLDIMPPGNPKGSTYTDEVAGFVERRSRPDDRDAYGYRDRPPEIPILRGNPKGSRYVDESGVNWRRVVPLLVPLLLLAGLVYLYIASRGR